MKIGIRLLLLLDIINVSGERRKWAWQDENFMTSFISDINST